jgi:hypothetical protein
MPKITLRPTILADLPNVVGGPLPYRIRAITALADERIIGMGGIAFPPDGPAIAFVQLAPSLAESNSREPDSAPRIPEARRYPVAFHRAGLMAMKMIGASGVAKVIATADADSAVAVRWLKRLGFGQAERQPIARRILFEWINNERADGTP